MESIILLLIVGLISFLIFLLCRTLNCWYWKINKRVELLEEQNRLLSELLKKLKNIG